MGGWVHRFSPVLAGRKPSGREHCCLTADALPALGLPCALRYTQKCGGSSTSGMKAPKLPIAPGEAALRLCGPCPRRDLLLWPAQLQEE